MYAKKVAAQVDTMPADCYGAIWESMDYVASADCVDSVAKLSRLEAQIYAICEVCYELAPR